MDTASTPPTPTLEGTHVRLEPMTIKHLEALAEIAFDPQIWQYMITWVRTRDDLRAWIESALAREAEGAAMPWVTVDKATGQVMGSTRFYDLDMHHGTTELGHTWLTPRAHGTAINPEAKLLQLRYAFETLGLVRVELRTHHENRRSQAAIRKLGATFEGFFRNHYRMPDGSRRHSVYYSITDAEWPAVKAGLEQRLLAFSLP